MKKLFPLVALPLLIAPASAAVILSSDFTGVVANDSTAPYFATGIAWTTSNLTLAGNDLEFTGPTGNAFITAGTAADNIQVNRNVETAGSWSATITFTPTSDLDLASFSLFYRAISGAGANQNNAKDALVTVSVYQGVGTGGTLVGSASDVVTDAGGGTAAGDTALVDLSSLANLTSGQAYTLQFTTASNTSTGGNNWAIDNLSLDGVTVGSVPEPSVAFLGGLGLIGLLRRRR